MRRLLACLISFGIVAFQSTLSSAASSWDELEKLLGKYYLFDNQKVDRVTCRIFTPTLDPVVLRQSLKPAENMLKLEENLADFKVFYTPKNGITFNIPTVKVSLKSPPEKEDDRKKLETGVQQMNMGYQISIQGIVQGVEGVLTEFVMPKKDSISDLTVAKGDAGTTVEYVQEGTNIKIMYSGSTRKTHSEGSGNSGSSFDRYDTVNGKYYLSTSKVHALQGSTVLDGAITIQREDLGKIIFPSAILTKVEMSDMGMRLNVDSNVFLTDCTVE